MKYSPLDIINHFYKNKNIQSKMMYGSLIDKPDLCIVIPVYGWGPFLNETLLSIKNQLTSDIRVQILISDNGREPLKFIEKLKNFQFSNLAYYISEKTLGQFGNFNRAIELANSEYVSMIHDDDLLSISFLNIIKKILPYLKNNNDIGLIHERASVFTNSPVLEKDNKEKIVSFYKINNFLVSLHGSPLTGIPSCGYLVKKSIFMETGGFNPLFSSSGDAFPSAIMMLRKYKVYQFNTITGYYRINNNSSLKLEVCQNFIKEDYEFGKAWSKKGTIIRRLFMHFFENYRYSKNIETKVNIFGRINKDITIENLDFLKKYKKYKSNSFIHICFLIFSKLNGYHIKKTTINI